MRLELRFLGGLSIHQDGAPLTALKSQKGQALLCYLALTGKAHARPVLAGLFWPEMPEGNALLNLRNVLNQLNQHLAPYLAITRQSMAFNQNTSFWLDVTEFEAGVAARLDIGRLQTAVTLYHGDFLDGFYLSDTLHFDEWVLAQRGRLRAMALLALHTLVTHFAAQADYETAITYARQLLDIEPWQEEAHRELMRLLAFSGQRSAALVQYETCRRILAEELGVEPNAETEALYQAIRRDELGQGGQNDRVRGYELREKIGEGGYGTVYRAYQPAVEREVAIKVIRPGYANDPDFIRRFQAEAQTVAHLEHPHIVPLYDYWREPDGAYLVMRWLRGGNLKEALQAGPWPAERALTLVEQVAAALHLAHRHAVVHRDVKPANILLDEQGNVYLSDFGIARRLGSQTTQDGSFAGSPDYVSPEQIVSEPVTPQSDIYSLGVVMYEILAGTSPFAGETVAAVLHKHMHEPLPLLNPKRPELPPALDLVIQRATAKNAAERYPDAPAFAAALRQALVASPLPLEPALAVLETHNPYKGLHAFEEVDAALFFGRETFVERLLARLILSPTLPLAGGESEGVAGAGRFLAVVGPSGSGKSSVVKAGLIPALRRGALPGSEDWFIVEMTPGTHPLEELEAALLRVAVNPPATMLAQLRADERGLLRAVKRVLPGDATNELLLLIDQFEELFTLVADPAEVRHILDSLVAAVTDARSRIRVIITLRADFYDRPLLFPNFCELIRHDTEVVVPLTAAELGQAISRPAVQVDVVVEDGLLAKIVSDVYEQPGALPLLQFALTELFERRQDNRLTLAAYQEIGGVQRALGRRAEELYQSLDDIGRETARQLFLRLVTLGEGVEDTRRRVLLSELGALQTSEVLETSEVLPRVIDVFGRYRLLTFDHDPATREPTVEVAHEALLREWRRLRDWLSESRNDVRLQRLLANEAREWATADQDHSYFLRGSRLVQFEAWAVETGIALTQHERAFLQASLAARTQQQMAEETRRQRELETAQELAETERRRAEEQAQAAQRLRRRAVYLGVAALVAIVLAIAAALFSQQAAEQTQIAFSRELATASLLNLEEDPERSILLALEALSRTHTIQAEEALHQAVQTSRVRQTFAVPGALGEFGTVWLTMSPDGSRIFGSGVNGGVMWEIDTGEVIFTRTVMDFYNYLPDYVTVEWINRAEFSPDGSLLILPNEEWAGSEPLTGTITILAADTGRELFTFPAHSGPVQDVTFNPEGTHFASVGLDSSIKVWDLAASLAVSRGIASVILCCHEEGEVVWSVNYSPDGSLVVTTSDDETMKVWDIAAERELLVIDAGASDAVFSPDGQYLVGATGNGTILILETASGELHSTVPAAHGQNLIMTAFSPDGSRLVTSSRDATAKIWDFIDGEVGVNPLVLAGHGGVVGGVSFTSDGRYVITGSEDGTARLWDVSIGGGEFGIYAHASFVVDVTFSPDGSRLASASLDGTAKIWDVATQEVLFTLPHEDWVAEVEYHPDGRTLATTSSDGTARIWDGQTGEEILVIPAHEPGSGFFRGAKGLAYSPDGERLVTGGADQVARVWDAATGEALFTLTGHTNTIHAVAYSPNGRWLATADADGMIKVWDPVNLIELWTLSDDPSTIWQGAFDDTGSRLVVGHDNGRVAVWQFPEGEVSADIAPDITLQLELKSGMAGLADFSPDGNMLAVAGLGQTSLNDGYSGELLVNLGHSALAAVFSPDGRMVATAGNDGFVRLMAANLDELLILAQSRVTRSLTEAECGQYLHMDGCPE